MRGQSEAVGLAIIVALVIGSIIAYSVLSGDDTEPNDSDRILAENFAYVFLSSDIEAIDSTGASCGYQRMWRVLETANAGIDPCDAGTAISAVDVYFRERIENTTSRTVDQWGYEYELRLYREGEPSSAVYNEGNCGFERSGVARYPFGRDPRMILEFALCS